MIRKVLSLSRVDQLSQQWINIVLLPSPTGYMRLLAKCNDEFSKVVNNNGIFKGYETSNFKKVVKFHMHISPVSFTGSLYLFYFKFKWQPANVSLSTVYIYIYIYIYMYVTKNKRSGIFSVHKTMSSWFLFIVLHYVKCWQLVRDHWTNRFIEIRN